MSIILVYCFVQLSLALRYLVVKRKKKRTAVSEITEWPIVTVQLPVFNELYVVERLVDAVCALDYPKDKLQVQLLDDSTDESLAKGAAKVAHYAQLGFDIEHVRRPERKGYKAGALQYGLQKAKGEFIAIFDADFVPKPSFLKDTLPHFLNSKTGVVQTRWGHLNRNHSLLTRLQAFALDLHFTVEQRGRNSRGYFINFNGTAGVWRKRCIEDAGGWRAKTLTEDLDLSYRAQLKGWKFVYLEDVTSPAELPMEINALKSQQYRWNRGGAQTARLMIPKILGARLPIFTKVHGVAHLLNSSVFVFVLLAALVSLPMLFLGKELAEINFYKYGPWFLIATLSISGAYFISLAHNKLLPKRNRWVHYVFYFPLFLSLTLGLALHNGVAVLKGFFGGESPFIRTPKFNVSDKLSWRTNKYLGKQVSLLAWLEGLLALCFLAAIVFGIASGNWGFLPFHVLAAFGFGAIFYYSLRHAALANS